MWQMDTNNKSAYLQPPCMCVMWLKFSMTKHSILILNIFHHFFIWTLRATKIIHRSNKKTYQKTPLLSIFDFDACYEGSTGGQIGVEFNQESTGHVRFFLAFLLADQWEAENANFLVSWHTDKYERSKWGRIWPGIQWTWSQTCDTSFWPFIGWNSQ